MFDTEDHGILLKRLVAYGVEGRELGWFKSYLSNRIKQVNFKRTISDEQPVTIGVPQGSILGPLFIIFMNDAPDAIKQILDLYLDDTTLQASDPDLSVLELNNVIQQLGATTF